MQTNPIALRKAALVTACATTAYLILRQIIAVHAGLDRPLDTDEVEYLHSGWLMHQGLRLYRDFAEDHAPFLFVILKWLVPAAGTPSFPRLDLIAYVARARIFAGACGLLGLSAVAVLAYRAIGNVVAPLIAIAAVMAAPWVWLRALVQVRNDPPTLLLFWLGALLLLGGWKSERLLFLFAGIGIGLIGVAAIWNPKWPLESIVLGIVYLALVLRAARRGPTMLALTIVPPMVCVTAAVWWIAATVPLNDYLFFTFRFNKLLTDWTAANPILGAEQFQHPGPYTFCPPVFKGVWPVIAAAVMVTLLVRRRMPGRNLAWIFLALAAAATLEIRFLYAYPNVWTQYYVMWAFIAAGLYGMTAAALLRLIPSEAMRFAATITIALLAILGVELSLPLRTALTGWPTLSYLQRSLRPGETVWVFRHPIGAPDANFYWFAMNDLVPFSIDYATKHPGQTQLPNITDRDLPACRAERGLEPNLRFISGGEFLRALPESRRCLARIIASGRAVRTPVPDVWDLHPDHR